MAKNVIVELYELPQEVKDLGGEVFTDRVFDLYKESPKLTADPIGLQHSIAHPLRDVEGQSRVPPSFGIIVVVDIV